VPRYCIAIPTTPPYCEGATGAEYNDDEDDDDESVGAE
jgi:hypothetical protein